MVVNFVEKAVMGESMAVRASHPIRLDCWARDKALTGGATVTSHTALDILLSVNMQIAFYPILPVVFSYRAISRWHPPKRTV